MEWNTPIPRVLNAVQDQGRHLVIGDFNLHHPLWGGPGVSWSHAGAEQVVYYIQTGQLDLLLELETTT
jgi:hypothetical protein